MVLVEEMDNLVPSLESVSGGVMAILGMLFLYVPVPAPTVIQEHFRAVPWRSDQQPGRTHRASLS